MKKTTITIIAVLLIAVLAVGCSQTAAADTQTPPTVEKTAEPTVAPTPEPTATAKPTPEPTVAPTPDPVIGVKLQKVEGLEAEEERALVLGDFEIPEQYMEYEIGKDEIGLEGMQFTLYTFTDINDKEQFRVFGYRVDPETSERYDVGVYSMEMIRSEIEKGKGLVDEGKTMIVLVFDPDTALPIDMEAEALLFPKANDKKSDAKTDSKSDSKTSSKGNNSNNDVTAPSGGNDNGGGSSSGGNNNPAPEPPAPEPPAPEPPKDNEYVSPPDFPQDVKPEISTDDIDDPAFDDSGLAPDSW